MVLSEKQVRADIVEVGRRIYEREYAAANDGNISARLPDGTILTTPTGVSKGSLTPDMLVKIDGEGRVLEGYLRPSSEIRLHLVVYRKRADAGAVVHAHPMAATAFAVAGIPLDRFTLPEVILSVGWVPLAKYGTPSTEELAQSVEDFLENHDAILLQNHGVLTVAEDPVHALFKMETVEHFARISLYARLLGRENELPDEQLQKLLAVREAMRIPGRHPGLSRVRDAGAADAAGQAGPAGRARLSRQKR